MLKTAVLLIFLWKLILFFSGFFKSLKEQQLFKIEIFYKIINVFVTFDKFNAYLLNKSINFFQKNHTD